MKLYVFLSVFPSNYDVVINAGSSAIFVGMIRCFLLLDSKQRTYQTDVDIEKWEELRRCPHCGETFEMIYKG